MRYAVLSDIHSNLQAWNAVLLDIRSLGVDQIICLGDIVGYGPDPGEVLQSVHSNVDYIILGNHDAVACDKMDSSEFFDEARDIINWTKTRLNNRAKHFLKSLPLTLAGPSFRCAHGDFSNPGAFNYIIEPGEAMPSWKTVQDQLLFVGHTHEPAIHVLGESGKPHLVRAQDFVVEEGKRYIINVGSVGQPRDNDARASYCIYDTESSLVIWRRIPFDIDVFRRCLHTAGLSEKPSYFLRIDPRKDVPAIRDMIDFNQSILPDKAVKDAVQVQQLSTMKRSIRRWKLLAVILGIFFTIALSAVFLVWWNHRNRAIVIPDPAQSVINSIFFPAATNMLLIPEQSILPGNAIPGWKIEMSDRTRQSVGFNADRPEEHFFILASSLEQNRIELISPPIVVSHKKMRFEVCARKSREFAGNMMISILAERKNGKYKDAPEALFTKIPNQIRDTEWTVIRQTFEIPSSVISIRLHIRGNFSGELLLKDISIENKD